MHEDYHTPELVADLATFGTCIAQYFADAVAQRVFQPDARKTAEGVSPYTYEQQKAILSALLAWTQNAPDVFNRQINEAGMIGTAKDGKPNETLLRALAETRISPEAFPVPADITLYVVHTPDGYVHITEAYVDIHGEQQFRILKSYEKPPQPDEQAAPARGEPAYDEIAPTAAPASESPTLKSVRQPDISAAAVLKWLRSLINPPKQR